MKKPIQNLILRLVIINIFTFGLLNVKAEDIDITNPMAIIQNSTGQMIEELNKKKDLLKKDPTVVMNIVENIVIPHFAANTISRKVLGIHAKKVTAEEKKRFSEAFKLFMVRFYSDVFAEYTNETFKYLPTPNYEKKKRVVIKTQLIRQGGSPVAIDYKMQRSGKTWKIVDLKVEGISMVISNKKQFTKQISRDGIDTVITKLEYKNKKAMESKSE